MTFRRDLPKVFSNVASKHSNHRLLQYVSRSPCRILCAGVFVLIAINSVTLGLGRSGFQGRMIALQRLPARRRFVITVRASARFPPERFRSSRNRPAPRRSENALAPAVLFVPLQGQSKSFLQAHSRAPLRKARQRVVSAYPVVVVQLSNFARGNSRNMTGDP